MPPLASPEVRLYNPPPDVNKGMDLSCPEAQEQLAKIVQDRFGLSKAPNLRIIRPGKPEGNAPESGTTFPFLKEGTIIPDWVTPEQSFFKSTLEFYFQNKGYNTELLKGRTVMAPTPLNGWGHLIQIGEFTQTFANVTGANILLFDPMDFLTEKQQRPYKITQDFLKILHAGGDMDKFIDSIDANVDTLGDKIFYGMAKTLMRITLGGTGYTGEEDNSIITRVSKVVTKAIGQNRQMAGRLLQSVAAAEAWFSERPFAELEQKLIDIIDPEAIITAHSATIRPLSLKDGKNSRPALSAIPDPGYFSVLKEIQKELANDPNSPIDHVIKNQLQVVFAPVSRIFAPFNDSQVYTVPSDEAAQSMREMFDPNAYIVPAGTITGTIEPNEFVSKWQSAEKTILLSSNGNGSNIPQIYSALRDFVNAPAEAVKPFKITVFLGEHNDAKLGEDLVALLREVKQSQELSGKIEIVRTKDKLETGLLKNHYTKKVHAQFRTGGENAMDNGNMGCASINTWNEADNEQGNVYFMMKKGGAIPSAWPPEDYLKWQNKLGPVLALEGKKIPHFEKAETNFVSYLNKLFGKEEIAKKLASEAYLNLDNLSNLHITLILTQMMLNRLDPKKAEHHNKITAKQLEDISEYMLALREHWADVRKEILVKGGILN